MDQSSAKIPTEIPPYPLKLRTKKPKGVKDAQETTDTRTVESSLEEADCHETTARGWTRLESVVLGVEPCIAR